MQIYNNGIRYYHCLENPQGISAIPASIRGNVLKAMVNLAKYLSIYEDYKNKLKNCGIKWLNNDDAFNSFLRIVNNQHSNLGEWYNSAMDVLHNNEKLWLRFNLLTGLRKQESINSFNLIIKLCQQNKLSEYYNEELGILEHFKQLDSHGKPMFLRNTKNCYLSIIPKKIVQQIANSQPVYYTTIRKHIEKNKLPLRIKELRSFCATFLRKNGIISEYVDLIQGRIPKSVFARHYLKVDDFKALVSQVLVVTENLESSLLS